MKSKKHWRSKLYRITKFVIVSFIFLMTTSLVVITYLNYQDFDDKPVDNNYIGTTTRRVISTTRRTAKTTSYVEPTTIKTTRKPVEPGSPVDITTKKPTIKKTTVSKHTTTTKKRTTTKEPTTKKTTKRTIRDTTSESTVFPNAIDFWAWNIFDMINAERMSIGLDPLEVAIELRDQAEEAAEYWYDHTDSEVDDYLGKTTYYGRQLVNSSYIEGYKYLYDVTISNTDIARNKNYRYVGIATLFRERSIYGMATHYYIIIYE